MDRGSETQLQLAENLDQLSPKRTGMAFKASNLFKPATLCLKRPATSFSGTNTDWLHHGRFVIYTNNGDAGHAWAFKNNVPKTITLVIYFYKKKYKHENITEHCIVACSALWFN